jgi:hypothetical protein
MIADKLRLVDGFRGLPGGMDGSQDPVLTPETSVYYAENVVFRGGAGPRTRPGFRYLNLYNFSGAVGLITGATTVSGAHVFSPSGSGPFLILVVDGQIAAVNILANTVEYVRNPAGLDMHPSAPSYFCEVEGALVVQNGINEPKVVQWNGGLVVQLASAVAQTPIPVGKQMAYGHGRLFVTSTNGREVTAGDIAFGGSLTSVEIVSSSDDDEVKITTSTNHGFAVGDYVTLSGHSSLPEINGTYKIEVVHSPTTFSVATAVGVPGSGGQATKFNAGTALDALNFSETTFINEGGKLLIPAEIGTIKGMEFQPVQDTSAGQGDLIVFCDRGAATFAVSIPRTQWKETQNFQRVLFSGIGAVSEHTCAVNGDIFFRSLQGNGIRSYRNARAEFASFGQTPISSEMDPVFLEEDVSMLNEVSMVSFDNRLLMTCRPTTKLGVRVYQGIVALDFRPVSSNAVKVAAAYDGVWSGLNVFKLLTGVFNGTPRAFAVCVGNGGVEIWEISKDDSNDTTYNGGINRIQSLILTRAYDFRDPFSEKKLLHCDLWFSDIGGNSQNKFNAKLHYRQDSNPNWISWGDWGLCFSDTTAAAIRGYAPQLRAEVPNSKIVNDFTGVSSPMGYDFKIRIEWEGRGRLDKLLVHSLQTVENVGVIRRSFDCVVVPPSGPGNSLSSFNSGGGGAGPVKPIYYLLLNESGIDRLRLNETSTDLLLI